MFSEKKIFEPCPRDRAHAYTFNLLEQDPVVFQRLCAKEFDGKITIVCEYLQTRRDRVKNREPLSRS